MATYYVATLSRYVLVEATEEAEARRVGQAPLQELCGSATVQIRTVRPATDDEVEFWRWHVEKVAEEASLRR